MKDSKGTFLLGKTWHIPYQKTQNPLSHLSPMDLFSLLKTPENLLQQGKPPLQKWFKAVSLSCGAVLCCKGWSSRWGWIQILLKSRKGSLHEFMCIRSRLGGGETFLSTTNCMHKKFCLDESKPGRNTSKDLSLKISHCINKWCLWEKLGAPPHCRKLSSQAPIDAMSSPCTQETPLLLCDSVSPSCKAVRLTLYWRHMVTSP